MLSTLGMSSLDELIDKTVPAAIRRKASAHARKPTAQPLTHSR